MAKKGGFLGVFGGFLDPRRASGKGVGRGPGSGRGLDETNTKSIKRRDRSFIRSGLTRGRWLLPATQSPLLFFGFLASSQSKQHTIQIKNNNILCKANLDSHIH